MAAAHRFLATIVLGTLLGAAAATALLGQRLDDALMDNQQLAAQLETARNELEKMKENLANERRATITAVETHVTVQPEQEPSPYAAPSWQMALEKKARELLQPLVGRELAEIDYLLLPQIVNQRSVAVEGVEFRLQVNLVVVSEKIIFYISALPQEAPA